MGSNRVWSVLVNTSNIKKSETLPVCKGTLPKAIVNHARHIYIRIWYVTKVTILISGEVKGY